jgi:hypothetical protein
VATAAAAPTPHRRLGPVEAAVAGELRRHTVAQPLWLAARYLGLPRRSVRYHVEHLAALGLVAVTVDALGPMARWLPDGPPSRFDQLGPTGTCPCCSARDAKAEPGPSVR